MKRRDLNPGDVFVYARLVSNAYGCQPRFGTVRCVAGGAAWFEGAVTSPEPGGYVGSEALDTEVILLIKPEGRDDKRDEIVRVLHDAAEKLNDLADTI